MLKMGKNLDANESDETSLMEDLNSENFDELFQKINS